jgi:hypothetical protein
MPALSFSVHKNKIKSGAKRQSIRADRKNPIKIGDKLYLYWKQRSPKDCEKLGETKCTNIAAVTITKDSYSIDSENLFFNTGKFSDELNLWMFAIADGFNNWQELIEFFKESHGLPFTGVVIQWDFPLKEVPSCP